MENLSVNVEQSLLPEDSDFVEGAEAYTSPGEVVSILANEVTLGSEGGDKDSRTSPRRDDSVALY